MAWLMLLTLGATSTQSECFRRRSQLAAISSTPPSPPFILFTSQPAVLDVKHIHHEPTGRGHED